MSIEFRDNRKLVGLGVTGGIAAYKAVEVLRKLQQAGCTVRVAMTKHACEFVTPLTFRSLSGYPVIVDDYDESNPDPIAHINFSQTIDLFLIAPATANFLAKIANGIADDFLTSTYLASSAPVLVAPAMNPIMWGHPATARNVRCLKKDGVHFIEPDSGEMACGSVGPGRLSEPQLIADAALRLLQSSMHPLDMQGEHFLITTGATREEIDPVRFISNRSSGRMGFAIAEKARQRGAMVSVVAGYTSVEPPPGIEVINVNTAEAMRDAVMARLSSATVFIGAAAVADYRSVARSVEKIKKNESRLTLELERTPDILAAVSGARTPGQIIVGFAAETENLIDNASKKLSSKSLDMIVANDITQLGAGFDSNTNIVSILVKGQSPVELPMMPKSDVASAILDRVRELRNRREQPLRVSPRSI
jgi:phosphopantothenoylcysteine decarboxylase / phosphopantothenate---cysteine ligase